MSAMGSGYLTLQEMDALRPQRMTKRGEHVTALAVVVGLFLLMWLAAALGNLWGGPDCTHYEDGTSVCGAVVTCQQGAGCDS